MAKIDAFFKLMHEQGASDLHLVSGQPPALRIRGDMERIKYKVLDNDELKAMLYEIAPEAKIKQFEETGDIDFGYEIPGVARYRSNFFMQKNGCGARWRSTPRRRECLRPARRCGAPSSARDRTETAWRRYRSRRGIRRSRGNQTAPCRRR